MNINLFASSTYDRIDAEEMVNKILAEAPELLRHYWILSMEPTYQSRSGNPIHSKICSKLKDIGHIEDRKQIDAAIEGFKETVRKKYSGE